MMMIDDEISQEKLYGRGTLEIYSKQLVESTQWLGGELSV